MLHSYIFFTDHCNIIGEEVIRNNLQDFYLIFRFNKSFYNTIGSLNLFQPPMLTSTRLLDKNELYYPYIKTKSNKVYLFEGGG